MAEITLRLCGIAPLIMHADTLADPLHPLTKEFKKLTSQKNKTDAVHEEIAYREWMAGLYTDDDGAVVVPADNVMRCLVEGMQRRKLGKKTKAAVFAMAPWFKLEHEGPLSVEALYETDGRRFVYRKNVGNQRSRVVRVRPIFRQWKLVVSLDVDTDEVTVEDVTSGMEAAGRYVGLCERRPMFGRFEVE